LIYSFGEKSLSEKNLTYLFEHELKTSLLFTLLYLAKPVEIAGYLAIDSEY
jgi:hypothetical protein